MQCDTKRRLTDRCRYAESELDRLRDRFPAVGEQFDVTSAAASIVRLWQYRGYHSVPNSISAIWQQIRDRMGDAAVGQFNRMLICKLISTAEKRIFDNVLPEIVVAEYAEAFNRVLGKMNESPADFDDPFDDTFLKDLGICSQTMIPAGYCALDITKNLRRELLFSGGLGQFMRFFGIYVVRYRCSGPFLCSHFHDDHREKFSPEGRVECFRIIARLMACRPEFKAAVGTAWYYDPSMRSVSPHLAYVRAMPEENGAYFFRGRIRVHDGALISRTRRRLYEEGKYVPRAYTMIWPREELIDWAGRAA